MANYTFTVNKRVFGDVVGFHGKERLSKLYDFEVRVLTDVELLGNEKGPYSRYLRLNALLKMELGGASRFVRGIVASVVPEGDTLVAADGKAKQIYRLRVVPRFWLAKQRVTSRIFQNKSTLEIVQHILSTKDYADNGIVLGPLPSGTYPPREYCMQYRESDYAFIKRILSEEGIFWYFDHGTVDDVFTPETLVLLDSAQYPLLDIDPTDGAETPDALSLPAQIGGATPSDQRSLVSFELRHAIKPNAVLVRDYDPERPRLDVTASAPVIERPAATYQNDADAVETWGTWESSSRGEVVVDDEAERNALNAGRATQLRVYEPHSPLGPTRVDADHAEARLQQYQRDVVQGRGVGFCRHLAAGYVFRFHSDRSGVTNLDQAYVATEVEHTGLEDGGAGTLVYENRFLCVPSAVLYRPKLKPKKRREIVESAIVVGPVGQDIHTDAMGRVRIQFQWDLLGSMNEHSSCWVRVVQPWTGTAFGSQFIPRVGTEVMVSFRDGDHDRPVVLGGVFNGTQPVPFLPPEEANKSGFRTRSTPGGNGYNELSFDDTSGAERVHLRAQTDLETYVGRDSKIVVEGSEVARVEGKRTEHITKDMQMRVGGHHSVHVQGAHKDVVEGRSESRVHEDRLVSVAGSEHHQIGRTGSLHAGDDLTTLTEGNQATVIGKHDAKRSFALHVEGRSFLDSTEITELSSKKGLRFRCGTSVIEVMPDQILLLADKIMVQAPGVQLEVRKDGELLIDADEKITAKSKSVTLAGESSLLRLKTKAELLGEQVSLARPESVEGLEAEKRELTQIELKDDDGNPIANQRFILVFGDGSEQSGFTDGEGKSDVFLEDGATIRFPGLLDAARA